MYVYVCVSACVCVFAYTWIPIFLSRRSLSLLARLTDALLFLFFSQQEKKNRTTRSAARARIYQEIEFMNENRQTQRALRAVASLCLLRNDGFRATNVSKTTTTPRGDEKKKRKKKTPRCCGAREPFRVAVDFNVFVKHLRIRVVIVCQEDCRGISDKVFDCGKEKKFRFSQRSVDARRDVSTRAAPSCVRRRTFECRIWSRCTVRSCDLRNEWRAPVCCVRTRLMHTTNTEHNRLTVFERKHCRATANRVIKRNRFVFPTRYSSVHQYDKQQEKHEINFLCFLVVIYFRSFIFVELPIDCSA